jgi:6-pyruvoyl-tetrahydropterin synthase
MTKFTRVGTVISVGHNSPEGVPHGHSYEVWATFRHGHDARILRTHLEAVTKPLDHTFLPDELRLAENFAERIGEGLPGCIRVECGRPLERFCGVWEA